VPRLPSSYSNGFDLPEQLREQLAGWSAQCEVDVRRQWRRTGIDFDQQGASLLGEQRQPGCGMN
jgi:hypothetical protein